MSSPAPDPQVLTSSPESSAEDAGPPPSEHVDSRTGSSDVRRAAIVAAAYVLFLQVVSRIPTQHYGAILTTTIASLLFTLAYTVYLARGLCSNRVLAAVGLLSFCIIAPSVIIPFLHSLSPENLIWNRLYPYFAQYRLALHAVPGVDGLVMVACAVSIGALISRVVSEFNMLLPISVVLAVIDLYVVFGGGLVTQAGHGNSMAKNLMSNLTVRLPTVHPAKGAAPMQLAVGFADFLFIGLFFACFVKFNTPSRRTFQVLCAVLAVIMLAVGLTGVNIPALVPIGVVVIGMNLRRFQFKRDELFAMLYAALIVGAIVVVLFLRSHHVR